MRAMRKPIHESSGIRVNCVCPGMTESEMTKGGIVEIFKQNGLYWQPAEAVAEMVLGLQVRPDVNGKAIYVEGGDGWEFEDGFYREQPRWLGEEATRRMRVNAEAVNKVFMGVFACRVVLLTGLVGCFDQEVAVNQLA